MRTFFLMSVASVLLAVAACGDTSSESNGEITSQQDVQQLFETIMPDLVNAFADLFNQQFSSAAALSSSGEKGGNTSTLACSGGGTLVADIFSGEATLSNCSVSGVIISATLLLYVEPTGPSSYLANFSGPLNISGTFTGTVDVIQALIQWMDPATTANTFWDVTVMVGEQTFSVVGGGGALDCEPYTPVTPEPGNGPCDDDSDCQSHSCRDPAQNPSEGCTCRHPDGGECPVVDVSPGSVPFQGDCDDDGDCEGGLPCIDCICI